MILGFDVNFLIKLVLGIAVLYGLILLAVTIFGGSACAKTMLRYTAKFWWIILAVIAFIMISKRLKGKKEEVGSKIEELRMIDSKTRKDERELKRLEEEKKKIDDEIKNTTDGYKKKLDELKKKPSKPDDVKPGDASDSYDKLKNNW